MAKSVALAADPSRLASLLLSYIQAVCAFVAPRHPGASAAIIDRLGHSRALSQSPSRPIHPGWLRCSSVTYKQYAPSSRLAIRTPRPRSSTDLAIRGPWAVGLLFTWGAAQRKSPSARGKAASSPL